MDYLKNTGTLQGGESTKVVSSPGKAFRLYIPAKDNLPDSYAVALIDSVNAMGLASVVPISIETHDDNLRFLQLCVDPLASRAQPYLEIVIVGDSCSVLHFCGDDIEQELAVLAKQISLDRKSRRHKIKSDVVRQNKS